MYEFRHPGIGHFRPWFNADVRMTGDIEMEGNFTVSYQAATSGSIEQGYPSSGVGDPTGYGYIAPKKESFAGGIKSASSGGLKIRTTTQTGLEIVFNKYGNSGEFLGLNITGTTDTYAAVQVEDNSYTVSIGSDKASAGLTYAEGGTETIAAWNPDSSSTVLLGDRTGARKVASGSPGDDDDPNKKGPNPHYIEYDGDAVLAEFKNLLSCPTRSDKELVCNVFLCKDGLLECSDNEDGPTSRYRGAGQGKRLKGRRPSRQVKKKGARSLSHSIQALVEYDTPSRLESRGTRRTFVVTNPATGGRVTIKYDDAGFPRVGEWDQYGQEGTDMLDNAYTLGDFEECEELALVLHAIPLLEDVDPTVDREFATEHIVEMNMLPRFFADAAAGLLRSGNALLLAQAVDGRFFIVALSQRDWLPALVPALPGGSTSRTIAERVAITVGSDDNRDTFVVLEKDLNGVKNRLWELKSFINGDSLKNKFEKGKTSISTVVAAYRNVMGVFDYLNTPRVHRNMITIINNLRAEFQIYQDHWNALNPTITIDLVAYWDEWIRDHLRTIATNALTSAELVYRELLALDPTAYADDEYTFEYGLVVIQDWIDRIKDVDISEYRLL